MQHTIKRWELYSIVFIIVFGTSLHFVYEWSDFWHPAVVIAAVNESTWEHFKMAFWPTLFVGIVEYFVWGRGISNFFFAKFLGQLVMPLVTVVLFYSYTFFWHHMILVDVIIFMISVIAGQLASLYVLIKGLNGFKYANALASLGLLLMLIAFSTLSFFPRENFIFAHPLTGEYGILSDYDGHDHDHE